jgi:2-polyprenyl-6-methoxyphenol hydroxylase-like FAD-dependent oxidoreductase
MLNAPIIVAGGGIGGLATALALAQKGLRVTVLERASRYQEIGEGIQLGPSAFHAFDKLKLGDAVRSIAVFIDKLRLMDAITAEEIIHVDLTERFRERFGNPYAVVHRGDLHGVLVKACQSEAGVELRTDCDVVGYEQDGKQASALLASGERINGRALIGADGLRPRIRQQMVNDGLPRVAEAHDLSFRHTDRTNAARPSLECRDVMGGSEMSSRPLSTLGLEGLQPCHHVPQ